MMNTLLRTARSAIMNMARDFSCGILTADDEILTVAESLPCHAFRGPDLQAARMKEGHPTLKRRATPSSTTRPTTATRTRPTGASSMPVIDDEATHRFTVLRQGPRRRLRQLDPDDVLRRRRPTSIRRAR